MTNNLNEKFLELEKLNAQIDIWIDDEEYKSIWGDKDIITLSSNVGSNVSGCFPKKSHCTHGEDKDNQWQKALDYDKGALPVEKVGDNDLKEHEGDTIVQDWSHLFYAKLLRAKIQQKGSSDCYTRRLDDVAAYLERHLPQRTNRIKPEQKEWVTRLTLIYLMELSAVSLGGESQGFSERAQRVITDAKFALDSAKASEKASYEFYDLWAHYNIGVAYFHQAYYRKAVLEFNKIIWQVEKWKIRNKPEDVENLNIFKDHHGIELLYLPAILYRAEVQLKLQMAYHTLDTLEKHETEAKKDDESNNVRRTEHRQIEVEIIKTQAYQQLGRLDKSWCTLEDIYSDLKCSRLGERKDCTIPDYACLNRRFPGLGERFIDILISDHLGWLKLEGEDERMNEEDDLELRHIVKYDEPVTAKDYKRAVDDGESYLKDLSEAFITYFNMVEHHAYNRSGYFQQLARYLGWLAKAADLEIEDYSDVRIKEAREKVAGIAEKLYNYKILGEKRICDAILEEEPGLDDKERKRKCLYCDPKGIDLRKLGTDHYMWFTDDMLKFFRLEEVDSDKKKFVSRLIKLEQRDREDLRIRDLELRYEHYGNEELLEKLRPEKQNKFAYARELCWRKLGNQAEALDLLKCNRKTITKRHKEDPSYTDRLKSGDYRKIMQDWDKDYLRHLQFPSKHDNHQKGGFYFMGLQRWNSASPAKGYSVGGGYLLYHFNEENKKVDMGIAIDPGFDFVRNLFHMGFSLDDIDIVLISHAHLDHIRDFESIVMLLSELKKRGKRGKRVHVILSLGAYKRLEHIVEDPGLRYFVEPYIIDVDREIRDDYFEKKISKFRFEPATDNKKHENSKGTANDRKQGDSNPIERFRAVLPPGKDPNPVPNLWARITPTRAYHDDKTNYSDSFGFLIELKEKVKKPDGEEEQVHLTFGYTGDTKWVYPNMPDPLNEEGESKDKREKRKIEDIAEQYSKCDVLLVHLGSLIKKDDDGKWSFDQYDQCSLNDNQYRCEELVRDSDHPYLIGMLRLVSSYYSCVPGVKNTGKPLVLVSEFGEELRGTIRRDFIRRLHEVYKERLAFLPVDVGLNVQMDKKGGVQGDSPDNRCACKVWCVQCNHFVNIDDADFELYGPDHALYCVCKTCRKATPTNVLQDRLRQLYEVGIELRTDDNK